MLHPANIGSLLTQVLSWTAVQENVLVATKYQLVEVFRRTPRGWADYQVYGLGDEVELTSIDIRMSLAALYELTDVPEALNAPEGEV